MNKQQFISILYNRLSGLPQNDINKSIEYYSEMIEDRIEDGLTEEEAVAAMGSIDDIVQQIYMNTPLPNLIKSKVKPKKRLSGWSILLIILGSPIWISLLIALIAVVFSLYIVLWSLIVAFYAVAASLVAGIIWAVDVTIVSISTDPVMSVIGFGCILALIGITILMFIFSGYITKWAIKLSKEIMISIKSRFVKRGDII
ncbi:MAG: DUF1700 domain-containing protein [Faecalibacterium sp.]|nr:DUF1700 domain-containing protein [Ruminococcus sp.]MCM1392207.1 DUF1700 domain-containing protein [Ruminococcus sp.]MCM1485383.1 DUF1700 domain-containing protein [Faecalibacterium sp.]